MVYDFASFKPMISKMAEWNIIVGPAIASVGVGGLGARINETIEQAAKYLVRKFWPTPLPVTDGEYRVPSSVMVNALTDTITSTAVYLSHLEHGYVRIDDATIEHAARLFEQFGETLDCTALHGLTLMVNGYDNYLLLHHYGSVKQSQFVSGELHRPWISYTLEGELELLIELGSVVVEHNLEAPFVKLTAYGQQRYATVRSVLIASGFLARRASMMRMSEFGQLEDYDALVDRLADMNTARRLTLQESGIRPGMHVLELGCGTGALTMDAGLSPLVEPNGEIVATDPSLGMLIRAERKAKEYHASNVSFVQSSAEELPFEDDTFDAAVGCSFLHFTDIPLAIREVHRVVKPHGTFTTYFPLDYSRSNLFFREWFVPVLSGIAPASKQEHLPDAKYVPDVMKGLYRNLKVVEHGLPIDHRNPEDVVRFFVQVANVFESAFEKLPWRAKQDMLNYLVERGRYITSNYPQDDLIQIHPHQLIHATVEKRVGTTR